MAVPQDAVALVTGASRGLGRAIAVALADIGVDVAINYKTQDKEAQACADDVRSRGRRAAIVQADVSKVDEVRRLVRESEAALGPVTILVNNAGIARTRTLDEVTEADWDELIDVNLKSAFFVSQAVVPTMRKARWGRIINISSTAAHVGGIVGPHYAAAKAGMIGLGHFFASRLARDGITVNVIAPALIATDMLARDLKASADRIPVGRFGTPEEVGGVVAALVQNGYVTGQTISVNGGLYMT